MMSNYSFYVSTLAYSTAILALSGVILGFTLDNIVYDNSRQGDTATLKFNDLTSAQSIILVPSEIGVGGIWALFAAGLGGAIDSALLLGLIAWYQHSGYSARCARRFFPLALIVCFVSVARSIAAVTYAFIDYANSADFDIALLNADGSYPGNGAGFAAEKWNRQIEEYLVDGDRQSRLAVKLSASRGIAVSILGLFVVAFFFTIVMSRKYYKAARVVPEGKRSSEV